MLVRFLLYAVLTLAAARCVPLAVAEPPKAVEAVGHFGLFRFGGDEGFGDSVAGYGGTLTLPFARRWAAEADVVTAFQSHMYQGFGIDTRRSLLSGHLVYRRGDERAYWFAGFGPGLQHDARNGVAYRVTSLTDPTPVLRSISSTDQSLTLGYKTGVVVNATGNLVIRGEVLMQHQYVLPNTMLRIGVGWRF